MSIDRMLAEIPAERFVEWQVYAALEPFGEARQDYRLAQMCVVVAETFRNHEAQTRPFTVQDFLMRFETKTDQQRREYQQWQHLAAQSAVVSGRPMPDVMLDLSEAIPLPDGDA